MPTNTPHAKDDVITSIIYEGAYIEIQFDELLANDLGGKAKEFFSLAVGDENSLTTVESSSGALVSIDWLNRKIIYDTSGVFEALDTENGIVTDTFDYVLKMANGTTSTATVTLNVIGQNDRPVTEDLSTTGPEDSESITVTLKAKDVDDEVMIFKLNALPPASEGTFYTDAGMTQLYVAGSDITAIDGQATIYFRPFENYNGEVSFLYTANDGEADSLTASGTIIITPVDELRSSLHVDFEDRQDNAPIQSGYMGFDWTYFNAANGPGYYYMPIYTLDGEAYWSTDSGYHNAGSGTVSFTPVGFDPVVVSRSNRSDFVFDKVELTSAWNTWMTVQIRGYNDGEQIFREEITINNDEPTVFNPSWTEIDQIEFDVVEASGIYEGGGGGDHLVLDNFYFMV